MAMLSVRSECPVPPNFEPIAKFDSVAQDSRGRLHTPHVHQMPLPVGVLQPCKFRLLLLDVSLKPGTYPKIAIPGIISLAEPMREPISSFAEVGGPQSPWSTLNKII